MWFVLTPIILGHGEPEIGDRRSIGVLDVAVRDNFSAAATRDDGRQVGVNMQGTAADARSG